MKYIHLPLKDKIYGNGMKFMNSKKIFSLYGCTVCERVYTPVPTVPTPVLAGTGAKSNENMQLM
jgi:hypothetical protein